MSIVRFFCAAPVAIVMLLAGQAEAAPCSICGADAADMFLVRPIHWTEKTGGWKFRTRLNDVAPLLGDIRRFQRISTLTSGNDSSAVSLSVERYFSNKRKAIELTNMPSDRQRRSRLEVGYDVRTLDNDHLGFALSGSAERRRLGFAALRGKWANSRTIGVRANWIHAEQWRLTTSYTLNQSQNPRTGIRRSIQLAAGAPPSAAEMLVAVDYSPSFLLPESFRVGVQARSDHLSSSDAAALAMHDRDDKSLSINVHMLF